MKKILIIFLTALFLFSCERNEMFNFAKTDMSTLNLISDNTQLILNWTAVTDAVTYEVWYSINNDPITATLSSDNITGTTHTIVGLTNGTQYYIWLKAKKTDGTIYIFASAIGTPFTYQTTLTPPGAPVVTAGNTILDLSWSAVPDADFYDVWFNTVNDPANATQQGSNITSTNFTIAALTNNTLYYVWVSAKNSTSPAVFSPSSTGTPAAVLLTPDAPLTLSLTPGNTQLTLIWESVPNAAVYEIWWGTTNNPDYSSKFGDDINGLSCTITGLSNGTIYYIWVKAKNTAGTSGFSPITFGTSISPPNPPATPYTTSGALQIVLNWPYVIDATAYEVWWGTTTDSASANQFGGNITGLSCTITGLTNGTTYYMWVKAKNPAGTSGFSSMATGMPN